MIGLRGAEDRLHLIGLLEHPQRAAGDALGPRRPDPAFKGFGDLGANPGSVPGDVELHQCRGRLAHRPTQTVLGVGQRGFWGRG